MDANDLNPVPPRNPFESPQRTLVEVVPELAVDGPQPPPVRKIWLHALLFLGTCASTLAAGVAFSDHCPDGPLSAIIGGLRWPAIEDGLMYSGAVMTILLCHEMGHFVQACRYGVYASLPYFIPMPPPTFGTFGAVIRMDPQRGNRKAIFDIGISGPLAGLLPTLVFLWLGLSWSEYRPINHDDMVLGTPLLVKLMASLMHGTMPAGSSIAYHPVGFAAWVGLLVTSINLMPIGQLDGGHISYGMFRKKAHAASMAVLVLAISASIFLHLTSWWLMLGLITMLGTRHPPTADDSVPLGAGRYVLGILTLAFLLVGLTPAPISFGH
jgi:membrane-associated protease RseP (regulator of RpoE activity)